MDTNLCIIRIGDGERVSDTLGNVLDTPDMATIGAFAVSKDRPTELHYHDFDEYWYFTEGTTTVTLRTADGQSESYRIGPGDLVITPKGVEHGHIPDDVVKGVQWVSLIHPDARRGHLHREFTSEYSCRYMRSYLNYSLDNFSWLRTDIAGICNIL